MADNPDLKLCIDALNSKRGQHLLRWRYYRGEHPSTAINPKMREIIENGVVFVKNWCQAIVDAALFRIGIQSWTHEDETVKTALANVWKSTLRKCAFDLHRATLVTGESYLIAQTGEDGLPRAYYHDPTRAHVVYAEDDPDTVRVACKSWTENKKTRINLYYVDRIEKYEANGESTESVSGYRLIEEPGENPYGIIPVFHFRLDSCVNTGELTKGVLSLQDLLNKLLNDMAVVSEFSAFEQRFAIGNFSADSVVLTGPNRFAVFPPGVEGDQGTSVGAFPSSDPQRHISPMDDVSNAMAVLSHTPKHYFMGQGANVSGEALRAMEAPLISKIMQYQPVLAGPWESAMAFCASIAGTSVRESDIECIWVDPHTVQPMTEAQEILTLTQAKMPLEIILGDKGWTEGQIADVKEAQREEAALNAPAAQSAPGINIPKLNPVQRVVLKDAVTEKAAPPVASALDSMGQIPETAIADVMAKFQGMKVRK